jgi:hypothetical protein
MDDIYYKPPNILSLSGITLNDYISIEDSADNKFVIDEEIENSKIIFYNKIPQVFTSLDTWPITTNLWCWNCGFKFNNSPKFIPTYIREINDSIEMGVTGNMCSFNCVEAWIEDHYLNREERCKLQNNLCFLYHIFTGKKITYIKPTPSKINLLQYGGTWNEEKYLKTIKDLNV